MRTARAKIVVDVALLTTKTTIGGDEYLPGDFMVMLGKHTWGVSAAEAHKIIHGGILMSDLFDASNAFVALRPKS